LPQIAEDWETAIDALEQSTIVPRFLHPELIKNLISTKRQELHYLGELSDSEKIELYLDTV
jgi:glutamine synthetase